MRQVNILAISIIVLSFIIAGYFYPSMPDNLVTHWNEIGQPDGFAGRFSGLFFVPIVATVMLALLNLIVHIDPLKQNIKKFAKYYDNFIILILVFLFYIQTLIILWNIGIQFNMGQMIMPAMGALFFYIGILLQNSQRNWFIGIRTPWTLSCDRVWRETNDLGGQLFKVLGVLFLVASVLVKYMLVILLIPVLLVVIIVVVHSYCVYNRIKRTKSS